MVDFMRVKYENPKIKQSEIANQFGYSSSTLQRYRNDVNMHSPYRIQPINTNKQQKKGKNTNFDNNSHHDPDLKRPQMTSNDLKRHQSTSNESGKKAKTENNINVGFVQENFEINEHYLDELLQNKSH